MFLGQSKAPAHAAGQHFGNIILFLLLGTKVTQHQRLHQIADDRIFILQVVVQAQALVRQMLADSRHAQIGAVLAAKFLGQGVAIMAGGIGDLSHFDQQRFPFLGRQTLVFPVGPRILAPVVEEADIVVALLDRLDLGLDEGVQHVQIVFNLLRNFKTGHVLLHLLSATLRPAYLGWSMDSRSSADSRRWSQTAASVTAISPFESPAQSCR